MNALLTVIVTWLAMTLGLPPNYNHPTIKFMPEAEIYKVRYGVQSSAQQLPGVIAIYDGTNGRILLPQNWTAVAPADVSVLVHEMVHHLQKLAGLKYDCGEAREALAYTAQEKWLNLSGTDLNQEFGFDRFTLKFMTTCKFR